MTTGESAQRARQRLLPLFTFADSRFARDVAHALFEHGFTHIEIAFRTPQAAASLEAIRDATPLRVVAGTLLSREHVDQAVAAGAHQGVSPHFDPAVLSHAQDIGFDFSPGVATPSEAFQAIQAGVSTVKVFPAATLGGPAFVRSLSAVYPHLSFIPSGGITPEDIADYLQVAQVSLVSGSWLAAPAPGVGVDTEWESAAGALVGMAEGP